MNGPRLHRRLAPGLMLHDPLAGGQCPHEGRPLAQPLRRNIAEVNLPEHNERFAVSPEDPVPIRVSCRPEPRRDILCRREMARQVGNDDTHFAKTKVRIHESPDGTLAIFRGPPRIAEFPSPEKAEITEIEAA